MRTSYLNFTKARGHRTMMDALIPLAESLSYAKSFEEACEATRSGGEGTKALKAKLGRVTYVGDERDLPPGLGGMSLVASVNEVLKTGPPCLHKNTFVISVHSYIFLHGSHFFLLLINMVPGFNPHNDYISLILP
ncbi:hypothetical protein DL96DRAFT_1210513 [Flagelloscypha sp. PMI_526]|nr:hypothetical protein DL96DRAFT_1210513 [Flagelloscypha sp. PMI_526]